MDCESGAGACTWNGASAGRAAREADASLCLACPVQSSCVGRLAGEAGTAGLRRVLVRQFGLRAGEALPATGDCLFRVVRSGTLKTVAGQDGRVLAFHFAGELVAVAAGGARVVALEDTELCTFRRGRDEELPDAPEAAYLGRLWDMASRELLRERVGLLHWRGLPPARRVAALFSALDARLRARGVPARLAQLHLGIADVASYLGLEEAPTETALALLAQQGALRIEAGRIRVLNAGMLAAAAG